MRNMSGICEANESNQQ
jgi:hypothetical protein